MVKRSAGYKKWYASNTGRTFGDEDIEYSHCFGKVSSGIDFGNVENEPFDYNVRYLHNMDINTAGKVTGFTFTAAKEKTKEIRLSELAVPAAELPLSPEMGR